MRLDFEARLEAQEKWKLGQDAKEVVEGEWKASQEVCMHMCCAASMMMGKADGMMQLVRSHKMPECRTQIVPGNGLGVQSLVTCWV